MEPARHDQDRRRRPGRAPARLTGYTINIANPNTVGATFTSFADDLPAGFTYQPASTTGATTADPVVTNDGRHLQWNGTFPVPSGRSAHAALPRRRPRRPRATTSTTPAARRRATSTVTPTGDTAVVRVLGPAALNITRRSLDGPCRPHQRADRRHSASARVSAAAQVGPAAQARPDQLAACSNSTCSSSAAAQTPPHSAPRSSNSTCSSSPLLKLDLFGSPLGFDSLGNTDDLGGQPLVRDGLSQLPLSTTARSSNGDDWATRARRHAASRPHRSQRSPSATCSPPTRHPAPEDAEPRRPRPHGRTARSPHEPAASTWATPACSAIVASTGAANWRTPRLHRLRRRARRAGQHRQGQVGQPAQPRDRGVALDEHRRPQGQCTSATSRSQPTAPSFPPSCCARSTCTCRTSAASSSQRHRGGRLQHGRLRARLRRHIVTTRKTSGRSSPTPPSHSRLGGRFKHPRRGSPRTRRRRRRRQPARPAARRTRRARLRRVRPQSTCNYTVTFSTPDRPRPTLWSR